MSERQRVSFDGGPMIALPESALSHWSGIWGIQPGCEHEAGEIYGPLEGPTDYDRACALVEWAKLLSVGAEQGLVLDLDDRLGPTTTWVERPDGGVFLGGGLEGCSDRECVERLEKLGWKPLPSRLTLRSEALLVSTAAARGSEFRGEDHLRVVLDPGLFEVSFAESGTSVAGVRLRRLRPSL